MTTVINVKNLHKKYGENSVLKGISFTVKRGEIFALLGTNGAGKTTALECIEGLRAFDEGHIEVNDRFSVQLQSTSLPNNMKVKEALVLFSKWNKSDLDTNFIQRIDLDEITHKQYMELSTGQKRKLHLALALIGNPEIIFLDEPTAGLDVEARAVVHSEIKRLQQQGKTIIMASHDMVEVEKLCDRIAILKDGNIAFVGSTSQLTEQIKSTYEIHLKYSDYVAFDNLKTCIYQGINQEYSVFKTNNIEESLLELLTLGKKEKVQVFDVKIIHPSLEKRFMEIAKEMKK